MNTWGLGHVERFFTTDNTTNCQKAFEKCNWLGCLGHIIHLVVRAGFEVEQVQKLIGKIKDVLKYFHKSTNASLLLKENEEFLGFPELNVLSESPTRWNSFKKSGKRLLDIMDPVNVTLYESRRSDIMLNKTDWDIGGYGEFIRRL